MPAFSSPAHVLLALVSARTGCPAGVLTAELDLSRDLRLDSLARVELLTALRARLPDPPEITVADVLEFRTLGELQAAVEGSPRETGHVRTAVARPAPGLRTADLRGTLVITGDGRGTAHEVRANLAAQGIAATVVDEVPYGATGVIFLGGLRDDDTHVHAEALHAAREERRLFITVQDSDARAEAGGLAGLARHLRTEWPDSVIRALDLPRGPGAARLITTELLHGGATEEVSYLDGVRRELVTERTPLPEPDGTTHNVIVATGASPALHALARELNPKIVLPGPASTEDLDAVRAAWGPITGIVHCARTNPRASLHAALAATAADPIVKVCVVLAPPGDRTVAMANETLARLASARGWSAVPDDGALVREFTTKSPVQLAPEPTRHDFRAEIHPGVLVDESHSPLAWMIEWFVAASGATTLREVSLLRDPGAGTGPITVRGQGGKRLALVSNVTLGRATIAPPGPPATRQTAPAVTVRGALQLGWPLHHSRTDPAATDECLRLAAAWAREEFGGTAVATSVREVLVHRTGLLSTPGKVALSAGRVHDGRAECDVLLMDADGSARVELRGVRLLRHPR